MTPGHVSSCDLVGRAIRLLRDNDETCSVAESCTGGLLSAAFVREPGVSDVFRGGVVAYADSVKLGVLGVPADVLAAHGAVSEPVAAAMATGVRAATRTDWAASITGVAGPSGGSPEKPVGTVWIGVSGPGGVSCERHAVGGDRSTVQDTSVRLALHALLARMEER